ALTFNRAVSRSGRRAGAVLAPITVPARARDASRNDANRRRAIFGRSFLECHLAGFTGRSQCGNLAGLLGLSPAWTANDDRQQTEGFALLDFLVEATTPLGFGLFKCRFSG